MRQAAVTTSDVSRQTETRARDQPSLTGQGELPPDPFLQTDAVQKENLIKMLSHIPISDNGEYLVDFDSHISDNGYDLVSFDGHEDEKCCCHCCWQQQNWHGP